MWSQRFSIVGWAVGVVWCWEYVFKSDFSQTSLVLGDLRLNFTPSDMSSTDATVSVQSHATFPFVFIHVMPYSFFHLNFFFFFLHWILSSAFPFPCTCILKHCIMSPVQRYGSCLNTFVTLKQMCRLWTAAIKTWGAWRNTESLLFTLNRVFTGFGILYRYYLA